MLERYGMALFGGALGGTLFKLHDNLLSKSIQSVDEATKKDLFYLVRNGYKTDLIDAINKAEDKGLLGNTALSVKQYKGDIKLSDDPVYEPAMNYEQSQNAVIANLLKGQIEY